MVTPRVGSLGSFTDAPATLDDVSRGLRKILLELGFEQDYIAKVSSQLLKAVFLAWSAKFGVHKDHRRLLGYHADSNDTLYLQS